jgi:hypothetical protein
MGLPFSMPSYVSRPKKAWSLAVQIECFGLDTECLGGMLVDDRFWLEGFEASTSFFLIPKDTSDPPSYADAAFYADCIAFEHELAALAIPRAPFLHDTEIPWDVFSRARRLRRRENFAEVLREGYDHANHVNCGPDRRAFFKYDWFYADSAAGEVVRIDWTGQFEKVRTAVHLYNAALRQLDALTQFLCFYRVIENLSGDNGKAWVEQTISGTMDYTVPVFCLREQRVSARKLINPAVFGRIRGDRLKTSNDRFNVLEVTRARALHRLDTLRQNGPGSDVAKRLYKENRCGIAHGSSIRRHDFSSDFQEVARDLPLMRFLARVAIEEAIA